MARKVIDFAKINADVLALYPGILDEWLPGGRLEGREYKAKNPTRNDQTIGSFNINIDSGLWSDFATGESGNDPVSLFAYINQIKQGEAAKALKEITGDTTPPPPDKSKTEKKIRWRVILPVPDNAPLPPDYFMDNKIIAKWEWHDQAGNFIGYTAKVVVEGRKQVLPLTYCENPKDNYRGWKFQGFNAPRPLFDLHLIYKYPDKIVVVVEGEKCARALQKVLTENVVTTSGSSSSANSADWTPLKGRRVIIWRDNDLPGAKYQGAVIGKLDGLTDKIKYINVPKDKPDEWDCANAINEGMDKARLIEFIKKNISDISQDPEPEPENEPATDPQEPARTRTQTDNMYENPLTDLSVYPFRFLGYDGMNHYYLSKGSEQVITLKAVEHDQKYLTVLADLSFWEKHFRYKDKGIDWKFVKRVLIHDIAYKRGIIYQPNNLRNIGVWNDEGRIVIHLGGMLSVNGQMIKVSNIKSKYIYEKKISVEDKIYKPLAVKEAQQILNIFERFSFIKEISPRLLAGFVVAGLCGDTVRWKPHIWLQGPQGCGKSTILRYINLIMGRCINKVGAGTTEPGLRQMINGTSFPISYDEAEATEESGKIRIDKIIELMRSSASPENEFTVKGGANNSPVFFMVRSSFILASITDPLELAQDKARTVNLELYENTTEKWDLFEKEINNLLTPEFCGNLRARIFSMIPTILKNMDIFITAVRDELDSQRYGDVYGVLLGGSYALFSSNEIDIGRAKEWVKQKNWDDQKELREQKDETNCLKTILEKIIMMEGKNRSLTELVNIISVSEGIYGSLMGDSSIDKIDWKEARIALRRFGIMNTESGIIISNSHSQIRKILKDTSWSHNWGKILKRIPETQSTAPKIFVAGEKSQRGTFIHFEVLKDIIEMPDYDKHKGFI